jgi:hypothetical protein
METRDHAERIIYERRQTETETKTESMFTSDEYLPNRGEMVYLDKITQTDPETGEEKVFFHPGHTFDEVSRRQNLKTEFGKRQEIVRKKHMHGATAVEEEFKRLARRWKIKCGGSPRKEEAFYSKDLPLQAIWETSLEAQEFADKRLQERLMEDQHDELLDSIPVSKQSTEDDVFTFGTKHGNLKSVVHGRTLRMTPKQFAPSF